MRPPPITIALCGALSTVLSLAGCTEEVYDPPPPVPSPTALPQLPRSGPASGLRRVPGSADTLTITDWDKVRARIGVPDLTSQDLMTDRTAFWDRAERDTVLLTDGLLRDDNSRFELDHGFTEDDVDWEARFGTGYVLSFRPDLDMSAVGAAVDAGELPGAEVRGHLLVKGVAESGDDTWADDPAITGLVEPGAETAYLHRGCVPLDEALGPDANVEDQEAVLARHEVDELDDLAAWSIAFDGSIATARMGLGRDDVQLRAEVGQGWPNPGPVGFGDAFTGTVHDFTTGRIGYDVANTHAAAVLTLGNELPFAICNDVTMLPSPTG